MNYIDIIFLVIIIFFTVAGLRKGLIRSIGGILAIIVGFYGASLFYSRFSIWLQGLSSIFTGTIANILTFIVLFIIINRLFMFLIYALDKIFSLPIIGFFNKLFGAILGFLAGALIVGIIVLIFSSFSNEIPAFENSRIVPIANNVIDFTKPLIPKSIDTSFLDKIGLENVNQFLKDLPDTGSISVDELMNYLKKKGNFSEEALNKLKETEFAGRTIVSIDEVKIKLQDYLDKLK